MRKPTGFGDFTSRIGWSHRECVYLNWECSSPNWGVSLTFNFNKKNFGRVLAQME